MLLVLVFIIECLMLFCSEMSKKQEDLSMDYEEMEVPGMQPADLVCYSCIASVACIFCGPTPTALAILGSLTTLNGGALK